MTLNKFFSLKYCDLSTIIWNLDLLMRPMMMRIDLRNTKRTYAIFYPIALITTACFSYIYVFNMMWFVFVRCMENNDLDAGLLALSNGAVANFGFFKLIIFMFRMQSVRQIVQECLTLHDQVIPGSRFSSALKIHMRVVKKRALVFWFVAIANASIYVVKPIVLPGRRHMEDSVVFYGLEPMFTTPNYEIAFTINVLAVVFTSFVLANLTAFLIITTGSIEAQMIALSEQVSNILDDAEEKHKLHVNDELNDKLKVKVSRINEHIKASLENVIDIHSRNLNIFRKVEKLMRAPMVLEFILVITCLIVALVCGLENTYLEIPYTLMLLGMDCLVGQKVTDAGECFEKAVYNSKWENFSIANKKTVLLILVNSQKTVELSAGSIASLNYLSFMAVLKFIYSTYATIRSML